MAGTTEIEREASPSFNIYPNLVTPVAPTGLPFNLVWPITERRSLLEVIWFAPDWGDGPRDAIGTCALATTSESWERPCIHRTYADIDRVSRIPKRAIELSGTAHLPLA